MTNEFRGKSANSLSLILKLGSKYLMVGRSLKSSGSLVWTKIEMPKNKKYKAPNIQTQ
jgi:hypothetical protein